MQSMNNKVWMKEIFSFGNVFVFKFEARKTCQTIDLQLVNI